MHNKLISKKDEVFLKFFFDRNECTFDVTIALSPVYQVPQIYFRALKDGQIVTDFHILDALTGNIRTGAEGIMELALGYDFNPADELNCAFVHPCRTENIMSELESLDKNRYLQTFWNLFHL